MQKKVIRMGIKMGMSKLFTKEITACRHCEHASDYWDDYHNSWRCGRLLNTDVPEQDWLGKLSKNPDEIDPDCPLEDANDVR